MHISWARLASFCHLGVISDPLIVSKFHNETHDPKGQENKIYTIVKGRETFYRRHKVSVTSCSEVKYVLKRVSFGSKDCTKELKLYWFKNSLQHGTLKPIFYGDLVYKFKIIVGKPNFSDQFKKIIKRYKKLDITWISCDSLHAGL